MYTAVKARYTRSVLPEQLVCSDKCNVFSQNNELNSSQLLTIQIELSVCRRLKVFYTRSLKVVLTFL